MERIDRALAERPTAEEERQAKRDEIAAEPGVRHEPQAEAEARLESSWQPGTDNSRSEADAEAEAELEIEM